jgi:hypothetical protein
MQRERRKRGEKVERYVLGGYRVRAEGVYIVYIVKRSVYTGKISKA